MNYIYLFWKILDNVLNDNMFNNNFKDFISSLDNVFGLTYNEMLDVFQSEEDDNGVMQLKKYLEILKIKEQII